MMRDQPKMTVLDLQTFAASTLANSEGLTAALTMLESCLAGPDAPLDLIVQDLCSVSNLFEFIFAGEFLVLRVVLTFIVSDFCLALPNAKRLVLRIMDIYPTDPALAEGSFASALLQRLSSVTFSLPPDLFSSDTVRQIGRHKIYVEDALPVLALLCSSDFSSCTTTDPTPTSALGDPEYDNEEHSGFFVRHKKQNKIRRKNKNNAPGVDTTPLHKLGVKVPSSNPEAFRVAREITGNLKLILKVRQKLPRFQICS